MLVEALYYLANELKQVLVKEFQELVKNFCQRLIDRAKKTEHYRQLYRLLGSDGNIETQREILSLGAKKLQKGKLRIKIVTEFCPDKLEEIESESPLDDIRKTINE